MTLCPYNHNQTHLPQAHRIGNVLERAAKHDALRRVSVFQLDCDHPDLHRVGEVAHRIGEHSAGVRRRLEPHLDFSINWNI